MPLGIIPKCETVHEEMIEIMHQLQAYAPLETEACTVDIPTVGKKEVHADSFHNVLFGGDVLTAKRARGSKHIRGTSIRGKDRLEGLKAVVEDWHAKVCFLGLSLFVCVL